MPPATAQRPLPPTPPGPDGALHTVRALAERERDAALQQVAQLDRQLERQRQQLQQLHDYQAEQAQRHQARYTQARDIGLWQCHLQYGERLVEAIAQQNSVVQRLAQQTDRARAELLARERRVQGLSRLIEHREALARAAQARREQKMNDEWAARATWNRDHAGL